MTTALERKAIKNKRYIDKQKRQNLDHLSDPAKKVSPRAAKKKAVKVATKTKPKTLPNKKPSKPTKPVRKPKKGPGRSKKV